jgi:hypothetical protein
VPASIEQLAAVAAALLAHRERSQPGAGAEARPVSGAPAAARGDGSAEAWRLAGRREGLRPA